MKKTIFVILMTIFTITSSFAVFVEIGNGGGSNHLSPSNGYYAYGWSTFILTSEQIGQAIEINGINFNVSNQPNAYEMTNQKLYIKAVASSTVDLTYPNPSASGFQLVYDGPVTWDGSGWQGIDFDSVFSYNGLANLQFVWENRHGTASDDAYPEFYHTSSTSLIGAERSTMYSVFIPGNEMYSHPNVRLMYSLENEPQVPSLVLPANGSEFIATEGSLSWTNGENTTGVDVYLSSSYTSVDGNDNAVKIVDNELIESTTYSLEAGTMYFWKVVARNNQSALSTSSDIWSFATNITELPLPTTYDFDDVAEAQVPYGWEVIHQTDVSWTTVGADSTSGIGGSNALRLYNSSDPDGTFMAITPVVNGTGAQVRFQGMTTSMNQAGDLQVGIITDINNSATFELIETVTFTNEWTEFIIPLNHVTSRVAFLHGLSDIYTALYLDEITFELGEGLELPYIDDLAGMVSENDVTLTWSDPSNDSYTADNYKIYRDELYLAETTQLFYDDTDAPYGDHEYYITAIYGQEESQASNVINVTVVFTGGQEIINDSFEDYEDFALTFGDWTLIDNDLSGTYGFGSTATFTNMNAPMAFIIFNPTSVVPPIEENESFLPATGNKYAACFASETPINDDWLISQALNIGDSGIVKFKAKSQTTQYGFERFNVLVSNGSTDINDFTSISGTSYQEAPLDWTEFLFDLSSYANQTIRIAIQCVSDDAFIFMLDDFQVFGVNGTDNDTNVLSNLSASLQGNYPNPFNPETSISYTMPQAGKVTIEVFNVKGQKVKSLINDQQIAGNHTLVWNGKDNNNKKVASGIYFYKMTTDNFQQTRKMILMK